MRFFCTLEVNYELKNVSSVADVQLLKQCTGLASQAGATQFYPKIH